MTGHWANSTRRAELPSDWPHLREQRRQLAGGRCEWIKGNDARCDAEGTDLDHWVDRGDHRLENLRWLCRTHHNRKTSREAIAAKQAKPGRLREPEAHPGIGSAQAAFELAGRMDREGGGYLPRQRSASSDGIASKTAPGFRKIEVGGADV